VKLDPMIRTSLPRANEPFGSGGRVEDALAAALDEDPRIAAASA
jgi:hypothetical protein